MFSLIVVLNISLLQVVEISSINEHLISECEQKDMYMKCKVCQMTILKSNEQNHTENEECQGEWNQGREGHPADLKSEWNVHKASIRHGLK